MSKRFQDSIELPSCFATGNEYNGFIENSDGNIFAAGSYEGGNSICTIYEMDLTGAIAA